MKKFTFSLIVATFTIVSAQVSYGQVKDFNRLSVDFSGGVNKVMAPVAPGYSLPYLSFYHLDLGLRYMANSKFGLKLDFGMDRFNSTALDVDYKANLSKGSIQAVMNVGRVCNFEDFTKTISLLAHGGGIIGVLKDASKTNPINGSDKVGGFIVGLSPIFKVNERLAITTDMSIIGTFTQQHSFDYRSKISSNGFDAYYGTASIGATIYLGKKSSHVEWSFEDGGLKKRMDELEAELKNTKGDMDLMSQDLKAIESKLLDDDNDGVANYLDVEPNTREGATVNTKGQETIIPKFDDLMNDDPNLGLFYTVQLGVFSGVIPEQFWTGITPIYKLKIEDGTTRYYSGIFHSVDEAKSKLEQAKKNGLADAFITSYYKGKRITVAEADLILSTRGEEVLRPKP